MGLFDRVKEKREAATIEKARARQQREDAAARLQYQRDREAWDWWMDELLVCQELAKEGGATDGGSPLMLKKGEAVFMVGQGAALVEPRRLPGQWVGRSQGVSVRVMKGVTYRVGGNKGTYVQGEEIPTPIDTGSVTLTNQRVVFQGAKQTREWLFSKLLGYQHDPVAPITYLQVSNRQKTSGFLYDDATAPAIRLRLEVALAWADGDAIEVMPVLETMMREHQEALPPAPG
mgnify:CR=1 FL=1